LKPERWGITIGSRVVPGRKGLWQEKMNNNNNNNNSGNRDNNNRDTPVYYLLNAFNNSFPNIKLKSTTTQEIENVIKSVKSKNAYRCDEIPTNLLKISYVYITSPLNHICDTCLSSGILPQCLKYCVVKPLYEKGERNCISNCRLISLLTSFLKVFEKYMCNRLFGHLNNNSILVEEQFGFTKNLAN
jgi:hypothetical protein